MTEKQKMLMGILYNAEDQALIEERNHAKSLTRQFNEHWEDKGRRNYLIGQIFGSLGKNVHLEAPIYLDYGYRTTIGSDFFSNFNLTILDGGGVEIGNHVFIGPNVGIYTANHPADVKRREKGYEWALPVKIGDKVWIGGGATILPGVTIGDNSVIGAGSVVTKDIPANVVAAGNPCRIIKEAEEGDRYGMIYNGSQYRKIIKVREKFIMEQQTMKIQDLTLIALMAALTCILGPMSITLPFTPVPISFTNLVIYFAVMVIGMKRGTISYLVYLLIGAVGLPVFSGFSGGLAKLAGPTGGYLVGFIFLALISGFFVEKFSGNIVMAVIGMVLGTAVTYAFGTIWLCAQMHLTFVQGLYAGVIPYLPGDAAKIVIAIIVGSAVKKAVVKARVLPE